MKSTKIIELLNRQASDPLAGHVAGGLATTGL